MVEPTKFAPRKQLLAHFEEGWRLLPGHDYQRSDWAILVYMPTHPKPVPMELMKRWARRFEEQPREPVSNWRAGYLTRPNGNKLTREQVADIRLRLDAGEKQVTVAQDYHVGRSTISSIATGRAWAERHA